MGMMIDTLPILYSFRRCPYAMRARLAIAASGVQVQLREVVLRQKPAHLLEISPKGTVPVLLLTDQTVLEQSLDIMWWALDHSDPEQLLPKGAKLEQTQQLIVINDGVFKAALDRYKYPPRYIAEYAELTPELFAQHHQTVGAKYLWELDQRLSKHDYLMGATLGMADLAIAPFVRQYAHTDIDWFNQQGWTHLQQWLRRFLESARFARIMHKYSPWEEDVPSVIFPPL